MKLGNRLPRRAERVDTAVNSMVNGTIGGDSKVGMPVAELQRVPLVADSSAIAEGTFRHTDRSGSGFLFGGTVTESYGGITVIMSHGATNFSPHGVILFPAGLVLLGDLSYEMTVSPTTSPAAGGVSAQVVEITSNVFVGVGPNHSLIGAVPGSTVLSGVIDFGSYPFTIPADSRLNLVFSGQSGPRGVVDSHWEVEVDI